MKYAGVNMTWTHPQGPHVPQERRGTMKHSLFRAKSRPCTHFLCRPAPPPNRERHGKGARHFRESLATKAVLKKDTRNFKENSRHPSWSPSLAVPNTSTNPPPQTSSAETELGTWMVHFVGIYICCPYMPLCTLNHQNHQKSNLVKELGHYQCSPLQLLSRQTNKLQQASGESSFTALNARLASLLRSTTAGSILYPTQHKAVLNSTWPAHQLQHCTTILYQQSVQTHWLQEAHSDWPRHAPHALRACRISPCPRCSQSPGSVAEVGSMFQRRVQPSSFRNAHQAEVRPRAPYPGSLQSLVESCW